jgi:hypothetical protein
MEAPIYTGCGQRVKVTADALMHESNLGDELAVAFGKCVLDGVHAHSSEGALR